MCMPFYVMSFTCYSKLCYVMLERDALYYVHVMYVMTSTWCSMACYVHVMCMSCHVMYMLCYVMPCHAMCMPCNMLNMSCYVMSCACHVMCRVMLCRSCDGMVCYVLFMLCYVGRYKETRLRSNFGSRCLYRDTPTRLAQIALECHLHGHEQIPVISPHREVQSILSQLTPSSG